jgi:hypothetical protein
MIACAVLAVWLGALVYARDRVPPGLNNDAAQEALRGIYLVEGHHWEAITFAVGNSAETAYLYWMGALIQLFGPTTLAIQMACWPFALAIIWMVWKLTERVTDSVPPWVPLLTAAASLWLFHYARSGLRAITAPFFLAAFALLLDRVERKTPERWMTWACGAVLGISLYGYTAARVLPVAFAVYAAVRLWRAREGRPEMWRRYGAIVAGAALVSIPNLVFFAQKPAEFLGRGNYVVAGNWGDRAINVFWTALLPWYYPEAYRSLGSLTYQSDGVSAGLLGTGQNPINLVLALAMLVGVWRARRMLHRPVAAFLLSALAVSIVILGIAGPSLTRLLIVLPIYLVLAAIGFGYVVEKWRRAGLLVALLILGVGGVEAYGYFPAWPEMGEYYGAGATPIGQKAAELAKGGQRVLCVVSKDANVVRLLTHAQQDRVGVVEFYRRPLQPSELPMLQVRPDVALIEETPAFRIFTGRIPATMRTCQEQRFACYAVTGR